MSCTKNYVQLLNFVKKQTAFCISNFVDSLPRWNLKPSADLFRRACASSSGDALNCANRFVSIVVSTGHVRAVDIQLDAFAVYDKKCNCVELNCTYIHTLAYSLSP